MGSNTHVWMDFLGIFWGMAQDPRYILKIFATFFKNRDINSEKPIVAILRVICEVGIQITDAQNGAEFERG